MGTPSYSQLAFLWPALAAASASEIAARIAGELADLAAGAPARKPVEPDWSTPNTVALELPSVRLRDFSLGHDGTPTLVCAPSALHGATIADFAQGHSLVEALRAAGCPRLLVTDWRSAAPDMRFLSIDSYLADLNVMVDELGGSADLVGLCQGGWLAIAYAARFPQKVRKLVLAGAPIDIAAGESNLSRLAAQVPPAVFRELVETGHGRILGRHALALWGPERPDPPSIRNTLQLPEDVPEERLRELEARFRTWYEWTVDLPGTYYLEVVQRLYKENRLAKASFVALGQRISLATIRVPLFLLAAEDDDVVAPAQVLATEHHVGTPPEMIRKMSATGGHLGLFMGATTLAHVWPKIGRWLAADQACST